VNITVRQLAREVGDHLPILVIDTERFGAIWEARLPQVVEYGTNGGDPWSAIAVDNVSTPGNGINGTAG
jgi:hypothetical protein